MTWWTLLRRTMRFFWRSNAAVAAGAAVAAAVITGALLLGDSLRGSLRATALRRLGPVDALLRTDRFFREQLAEELQAQFTARAQNVQAGLIGFTPLLLLEGAVETADDPTQKIIGGVQVIGCDQRFWQWDSPQQTSESSSAEKRNKERSETSAKSAAFSAQEPIQEEPAVVLNDVLAEQLGVRPGQDILIRFPRWEGVAPESALGRKEGTVRTWRLRAAGVVDDRQWTGRFALERFHQKPLVVYVPLRSLQHRLNQPGRVNAILAVGSTGRSDPPEEQDVLLAELLRPASEDYGLRIERVEQGPSSYIHITTDRLLFEPALEEAVRRALAGEHYQAVLTYLANTIQLSPPGRTPITHQDAEGRIVPYSTVTAIDFEQAAPLGPFRTVDGRVLPPLRDAPTPEIVLNAWAAQSLGLPLSVGIGSEGVPNGAEAEKIRSKPSGSGNELAEKKSADSSAPPTYVYLTFFEPESVEGRTVERTERFRLVGIAAMEGPARDRRLTPEVPGLTDRRSIAQWETPFRPFYEGLIRRADDEYFQKEGLTPKAFVSLATGWRLWGSRFGRVSSFRVVPSPTATVEHLRRRIQQTVRPADLGFQFQPVKRRALQAAEGSTSFEMLFLGFSSFLILSAAMLVVLLFRLAIEARQEQLGLLLALGFTGRRLQGLLLTEGTTAAVIGSGLGALAGWGYAAMVLAMFRAWAANSLGVSFLELHVRPESFLIGFLVGVLLGGGSIVWAVRRAGQASPRQLLSRLPLEEETESTAAATAGKRRRTLRWAIGVLIAAAGALGLAGWAGLPTDEMAQAGAFFGAGVLVLGAGILWVREQFRLPAEEISAAMFTGRAALCRLAFRNAARNPRRSSLTVGLMAAAVFLLGAVSVFRLPTPGPTPQTNDGTGGVLLWVETTLPIFYDLAEPEGRANLAGWTKIHEQTFQNAGAKLFSIRIRTGDDASCRNLYRPAQPRILGLPKELIHRPAFAWGQTLAQTPEEKNNPWLLLERTLPPDEDGTPVIPAVLDADTATYALKVGLGQDVEIPTDEGVRVRFRIVGLLRRSIFQGDLLVSEGQFVRLFPREQGYRLFLTAADRPAQPAELAQVWRQALGEYGVRTQTTRERLAEFFAVQNTYLAAFQSLGGLGLLLGVLGLGVVQVRNVVERRRELALLSAVGFSPRRLGAMILWETWLLLAWGLGCGAAAAAMAVWPHWVAGQRTLPWTLLGAGLTLVWAIGSLAGLAAVRAAVRTPLVEVLRTE